jgi:hypothetical protein
MATTTELAGASNRAVVRVVAVVPDSGADVTSGGDAAETLGTGHRPSRELDVHGHRVRQGC